jgi:EAL domain-containing protein (putative c-di-GMP-specific phosphodiesterase class I)/GGDEF domain-containing protein
VSASGVPGDERPLATGLLGRDAFAGRLRESIARSRRRASQLAVLFVRVEPSEAAGTGGDGLAAAARSLRRCLRDGDPLADLGDGDFGVLIHDARLDRDLGIVARRLLDELAGGPSSGSTPAWIGIAIHPGSGADADGLLRNAETAMYQAKAAGDCGFHFFEEGVNRAVANRLRQESELQRAIEHGELRVHYQPQIDLAARSFVGLEALVRWRSASGLTEPASFFPAAESLGLMRDIGTWVLRTACRELREIEDLLGTPVRLGVNVARSEIEDPEFAERLLDLLSDEDRAPASVELELHERLVAEDLYEVRRAITKLREHGVGFALDGFGSSGIGLSAIRRISPDVLKIDRSLVHGVTSERAAASIVAACATLSRGIPCRLIGVGVEGEEQVRALLERGCMRVQGFAVSQPMPARSLVELLSAPAVVAERLLGEVKAGRADEEVEF